MKLPATTQVYLDLSNWWLRGFGWVYGWTLALALPVLVTLPRHPPKSVPVGDGRVKWLLTAVLVLVALNVVTIVTSFAITRAMFEFFEALSGWGK